MKLYYFLYDKIFTTNTLIVIQIMKNTALHFTQENQQELSQLLTTNKCLAMEKRELHRQKLRVYSQKAVKIRAILRQTTDHDERKCLEAKLKALQQKQDSQITKLAKIDQIQKQIDQFITDDGEEIHSKPHTNQHKLLSTHKQQQQYNEIQGTPALRLRTKSSMPYKYHNDYEPSAEKSKNKSNFSKKISNQELLLADSRQILEELHLNKITKSKSTYQQKSKQQLNTKQLPSQISSFKNDNQYLDHSQTIQAMRMKSKIEDHYQQEYISVQGIPSMFENFVEKVSKFWPEDIKNLIQYFKQNQAIKAKQVEKDKQFHNLLMREQKFKHDEQGIKKSQDRLKKMQQKCQYLIDKERKLMQRIDKLQKQQKMFQRRIQISVLAIINSSQLISQSSFAIGQHNNPIKLNSLYSDSNKLSISSMESCQDGSLTQELSKFQKGIQQYLLSAQKAAMLASGQLQQVNVKLTKTKNENTHIESKKKILEQQLTKMQQTLKDKKRHLKQLEQGAKQLQQELHENGTTAGINKSLAQELEQKCEKLKSKKKSLSDKVKGLQQETHSQTLRKQELFEALMQIEQKIVGLKTYQKELQTKIIFLERDKENRQKDIEMIEQKGQQIMKRLQQSNKLNEQTALKISQHQILLAQLNTSIQNKQQEEISQTEKARKAQQHLAESTTLLEQKTEQISLLSAELLSIQAKINQAQTTLKELQAQCSKVVQQLSIKNTQIEREKKDLQQIKSAKSDLQSILHEVMVKKQQLVIQIEERGKQLYLLLNDLQSGNEDYQQLRSNINSINADINKKKEQLSQLHSQCQSFRIQLDEQLEEEANIVNRLTKLKEAERTLLLGIGVKGGSNFLDEQLKSRVAQAVGELSALNELKGQVKDCKYENRKLKLEIQRLNKLIEN